MSTAIIVIIIVVLFFCILCCSLISSAAGIMNSSNSSNTKTISLTGEWYYKGFPDKRVQIIDYGTTVTVDEVDSALKRIETTFRVETRNAKKIVAISSENLIMESLDYKNLKIYSHVDPGIPLLELIRDQ